jgi:hypothetical protein
MSAPERWSADADLQYAVAKALHKAGYGDDVIEMHDAAVAAINVVQDYQQGTTDLATAEAEFYDCPDDEVCKRCPCADEDDVCFPSERLRAELEAFRQHQGGQTR